MFNNDIACVLWTPLWGVYDDDDDDDDDDQSGQKWCRG